jgi:hypothetical protein
MLRELALPGFDCEILEGGYSIQGPQVEAWQSLREIEEKRLEPRKCAELLQKLW